MSKKPLPKFEDKYKDAVIHVALKMIEKLIGQDAQICIKLEALENFPDFEKPIFVWDKSKEHWAVMNPKQEKPKKTQLALPNSRIIDPSR